MLVITQLVRMIADEEGKLIRRAYERKDGDDILTANLLRISGERILKLEAVLREISNMDVEMVEKNPHLPINLAAMHLEKQSEAINED